MKKSSKFPRAKPYRLAVPEIKALVRYRDGYRCTDCGMTAKEHFKKYKRTLDVHRIEPGSRYCVKGCVTLCRPCHRLKPKSQPRSQPRNGIAIRINERIFQQLLVLVERNCSNITAEVTTAIREMLTREGKWPPPPKK